MAFPTVDAPYGLKPVNLVGGQVFAGATRLIPIASGYDTDIFAGDLVKLVSGGTLEKDAGTATATPVGVFLGCTYTDPVLKYQVFSQYYPADTVASDIKAYVADDPASLFQVAVVSSGTTIGSIARTAVGNNSSLVQNAGSTTSGNSKVAISATTATTNTLPIRIIDVVEETATGSDAFVEAIVKINAGMHQYENATGV